MQLLLLLLIIFAGGKKNTLEEVMPILETFGNEDMQSAVRRAEELSETFAPSSDFSDDSFWNNVASDDLPLSPPDYPLSPIEGIADERATAALARYIALGR